MSEFRAFLTKSNALALAIGVIIGASLGAVVNSLVTDIIMPPIGMLLGRVDFGQLKVVLQPAVGAPGSAGSTAEVAIRYGTFLNLVIAFVIVAFVVYFVGKLFIRDTAAPATPSKACPFCREGNAVDATRCRACTSAI